MADIPCYTALRKELPLTACADRGASQVQSSSMMDWGGGGPAWDCGMGEEPDTALTVSASLTAGAVGMELAARVGMEPAQPAQSALLEEPTSI